MGGTVADCDYCDRQHPSRYLCAPARRVLDALKARGMAFNMPTLVFPEPLPADELGLGVAPGDELLRQLVVQAATLPVAGIDRPTLIFTGQNMAGEPLPRWIYPGSANDLRAVVELVRDMAGLAIRTATDS